MRPEPAARSASDFGRRSLRAGKPHEGPGRCRWPGQGPRCRRGHVRARERGGMVDIPQRVCHSRDVPWGVVELESEVADWIGGLSDEEFGRVEFYIDLLEEKGVHLGEPYTRQLRGKLRELRFYLGPAGEAVRISCHVATGRRIILLTVFKKQRRRERAEIARAERAMRRCIEEAHEAEDDTDG
jgi:hypothetical protein